MKHHFVLVHGACHEAWCWYKLSTLLTSAGVRVTALYMAASGIDPKRVEEIHSYSDYYKPLMEFMSSLPPEERVILVGHSLGGLGISLAMERFPAKISLAVFVNAFMPGPTLPFLSISQKYDVVGWAPKEYNPDEKQSASGQEQGTGEHAVQKDGLAPQSSFVWHEESGYYYDAASGFYYDGNTGLYYDGNNGTWYSYDHQTQQYVPCVDQNDNKTSGKPTSDPSKTSDGTSNRKVVISAPAATITSSEKAASLPDVVQAAATAALAAEKKEKEKMKEIWLASKSSILASKKKMSNVLTMWKQRNHEGQAARVVLDDNQPSASTDERANAVGHAKSKFKTDAATAKDNATTSSGFTSTAMGRGASNTSTMQVATQAGAVDPQVKPRPVSNSLGGTLMGVIRGSGRGVVKSDTVYSRSPGGISATVVSSSVGTSSVNLESPTVVTPFRIDLSALGSYAPVTVASGKKRFSEMPLQASTHKEQPQTTYRDRAAERRSLYGSSSFTGDDLIDLELGDSNGLCFVSL